MVGPPSPGFSVSVHSKVLEVVCFDRDLEVLIPGMLARGQLGANRRDNLSKDLATTLI